MRSRAILAMPVLLLALPAIAGQSGSMWRYGYNQGIGQYLTGEWDSSTGGALGISCMSGGRVHIMAQIKGQAPPANSALGLKLSSRAGSQTMRFATNAQGAVETNAASPDFVRLWSALRSRDIVTLRYADGRFSVQSLDGAAKTLPAKPCG